MDNDVINTWVKKYFTEFNKNPARVMKFYVLQALFTRDGKVTPGKDNIVVEFTNKENWAEVDIDTIETDYLSAEPELDDEDGDIIVNVWGDITYPSLSKRKFCQIFQLVSGPFGRFSVTATILSVHDD